MGQELLFAVDGPVGTITLNRPEKLNAMSRGFWSGLREILSRVAADPAIRAVVVTGNGPCFSVGGDIESFGQLASPAARRAFAVECLETLRAVEELPQPVIAAVHGYALGGGCELTMVCDLVVADETAVFGTPEVGVGLYPGLAAVRGKAHVSLHFLKEMVFLGQRVDAATARAAGLVNRLVGPGQHLTEAMTLAAAIADKAPLAVRAAKRLLNRGSEEGYDHSAEAIAFLHGTADAKEGVAAFVERRPARFRGE